MSLTAREKRTVLIGGIVAALLIVVSVVLAPLARRWAELGSELAPKLVRVEALRQRAHRCQLLVARRNRLARQLGSVLGSGLAEQGHPSGSAGGAKAGGEPDAPGGGAFSFAAHLERVAKSAKVKVKRISVGKRPAGEKGLKHFAPVTLQVNADGNIQALIKLLHGLEKGERLARVDRFSLKQDLKKPGALALTLDVVGYAPTGVEP